MAPTDLLHAANTLVGILGVASANSAIAAAASGLGSAVSMQEIRAWMPDQAPWVADRVSGDLGQELGRHQLPTQTRLLIAQMIAQSALTPDQIMGAARNPDQICAAMLANLTDPAHLSPKAHGGFQRVVVPLLTRHLGDADLCAALGPAFDIAMAAALHHVSARIDLMVASARDDAHRLGVPEGMLIALARRYVPDGHSGLDQAQSGLGAALEAVARMQARGQVTQNGGAAADLVVAAVNSLNAAGQMAEADDAIAAILGQLDARSAGPDGELAVLLDLAVDQARLLCAPDRAAQRILAALQRQPHQAGLFRALHDAWEGWFDRGHDRGIGFDLNVALYLARANLDRSKGVQRTQALADLGNTQYRLGELQGRHDRLKQSLATWRAFLADIPRQKDPETWVMGMGNLATVLQTLGERETGTARLLEAVDAIGKVLAMPRRDQSPLDRAASLCSMARAMILLADRTDDPAMARQALHQLQEAGQILRDGGHPALADPRADLISRAETLIARLSQGGA